MLRLGWPKSAETAMNTVGLDLVNLGGTNPECFFQAVGPDVKQRLEELGGTFFLTTVARMLLVALLLAGVTLTQMLVKRCAAWRGTGRGEKQNDTLEMIETVVFSMQARPRAHTGRLPPPPPPPP